MGGSGSGNKSKTRLVTQKFGGSYGDTDWSNSSRLSQMMEGLIGNFKSEYSKPMEDAILRPEFGPTSSSEQALMDSIMSQTGAKGAVSGLGAPTQSALASSIAPTLVGLRQQNIQNLMGGRGQDAQINQSDLSALAELIKLAMPQVVSGQSADAWGWTSGGGANGGCWVAREIYGTDTQVWLVFKDWLFNSSPKWFKWTYLKFGERFAEFIKDKPTIKKFIGYWMDKIVIKRLVGC